MATTATAVVALGVVVVALAADQGGYFPTSWGWATLALASAGALSVILGSRSRASLTSFGFAGAFTAFVAWAGLSAWWSSDVTATSHDVERTAIYAAAALLVPAAVARRRADSLVAMVFVAIAGVSTFSLLTRLFPATLRITDTKALARLAQPIGYWNGLACFASVGVVLAFGYAAQSGRAVVRCAAAASVVVLATTVYFTFSRAAWIALAVGCAFFLAFARDRIRLASTMLCVGVPAAVGVLLASRSDALTAAHVSLDVATPAGRRLALQLLGLCIVAAAVAAAIPFLAVTLAPRRRLRQGYAVALVAAPVLAAVVAIAQSGGPAHLARSGYDAFRAPPPAVGNNLNDRLINFSSDGRVDLWRVAWTNFRAHPLTGSGAGSYQRYFLAHQPPTVGSVTDAHNLYLETASELGIIGLVLLVIALVLPLAMLPRIRSNPLAACAAGAYVVFLAHAAADWDWELPAVTLPVVVLGAYLFHLGANESPVGARSAFVVVPAAAVLALVGLVSVGGNSALASSTHARNNGDVSGAITDAHRAHDWLPWSAEPWKALGLAESAGGDTHAARRALRHAARIDPGDWETWAELAAVTTGHERTEARHHAAALYIQGGFGTP